MAAVTDEIFEKYLQKAIAETNELGDEIARAAGEGQVPVLGSGHPLADVFLLKHSPQPAEVQEGVAFFGRAGQALLKSLQRLNVDPLAIYGTNCFKLAGGDEDQARAWLIRELHIVQPKLVVVMGEAALEFLNAIEFPLADAARADARRAAALHAHDPGALRARHRRVARRGAREDEVLERVQGAGARGGPSCRRTEPAPRRRVRRARGVVGVYYGTHEWWFTLSLWWDIAFLSFLLIPAVFGLVWLALPLWARRCRGSWRTRPSCGVAAVSCSGRARAWSPTSPSSRAMTFGAWCFLRFFEELSWVVLVA